jgi:hypothetical protein
MSDRIGFVILSHSNPHQLRRLVRCLQTIYDDPPIAIHHDFGQCPLRPDDFPSGIRFVAPHVHTRWAQFSIVTAALRALELLYRNAEPDWFVLLSGADYPTMPARQVFEDLYASGADALLDYREVPNRCSGMPELSPYNSRNRIRRNYDSPENRMLAWHRYIGFNVWFPTIRKGPRIGRYTVHTKFADWRSPFGASFKCFYGDQWFTGNHRVAEVLLHPDDNHMKLRRHLRLRTVPDECYYQSVLCNATGLKISTDTRRFAEWLYGQSHPQELGLNDLPEIISSKAHFARKFAPGSPVLNEIDKLLGQSVMA